MSQVRVATSASVDFAGLVTSACRSMRAGTLEVVGVGIDPPADLTLGALATIVAASAIYSFEPPAFVDGLRQFAGVDVVDQTGVFDDRSDREEAIRQALETVIRAAASASGVVLLLGGHPTTAVAFMSFLPELAERAGVSLRIRPGVSSVDHMLADLALDPVVEGLQLLRGSTVDRLRPSAAAAILCPAYARTIGLADRTAEAAQLSLRLGEVYGEAAEFFLYVRSSGRISIERLSIDDVLMIGTRPYLGNLMVLGPVGLLPERTVRILEAAGGVRA